jgi:hypothetical protein
MDMTARIDVLSGLYIGTPEAGNLAIDDTRAANFSGLTVTATTIPAFLQTDLSFCINGDSLSAGTWSPYMAAQHTVFDDATITLYTVPGGTVETMVSNYTTQPHTVSPAVVGGNGVYCLWGGINDLYSLADTPATVYGRLKSLWASARADGYKVCAFTLTPTIITSLTEDVADLNALILSDQSLYDWVIRTDMLFPDPTDTTYWNADGIHFIAAGYEIIAETVAAHLLIPKTELDGHVDIGGDLRVAGRFSPADFGPINVNGKCIADALRNLYGENISIGMNDAKSHSIKLYSGTDVTNTTQNILELYSAVNGTHYIYGRDGQLEISTDWDMLLTPASGRFLNLTRGGLKLSGTERITAAGVATLAANSMIAGIKHWGKLAAAPTTTNEGDEYYDTVTHKKYVWDASAWQACW